MQYVSFDNEKKAKMFDEIAAHFYNANFGQFSKSDMELLMFHFYMKQMIDDNHNLDNTIDYRKCSDYKISQDLGITQQRVRNLKVKSQLIYPIEYNWRLALATLTEHARYDDISKRVVLNIPDPNLYLEIQNFIEENGAYVEKQLNSKVLQIRAEYYIDLIIALEPESTRKSIIKTLKEQLKESGQEDSAFDEHNVGKSLIDSALNVTTIAANISSIISPENVIGLALIKLLTKS